MSFPKGRREEVLVDLDTVAIRTSHSIDANDLPLHTPEALRGGVSGRKYTQLKPRWLRSCDGDHKVNVLVGLIDLTDPLSRTEIRNRSPAPQVDVQGGVTMVGMPKHTTQRMASSVP
jgi:hypothetical protein